MSNCFIATATQFSRLICANNNNKKTEINYIYLIYI